MERLTSTAGIAFPAFRRIWDLQRKAMIEDLRTGPLDRLYEAADLAGIDYNESLRTDTATRVVQEFYPAVHEYPRWRYPDTLLRRMRSLFKNWDLVVDEGWLLGATPLGWYGYEFTTKSCFFWVELSQALAAYPIGHFFHRKEWACAGYGRYEVCCHDDDESVRVLRTINLALWPGTLATIRSPFAPNRVRQLELRMRRELLLDIRSNELHWYGRELGGQLPRGKKGQTVDWILVLEGLDISEV